MKVLEEDMEVTAETVANLLQCLPRGFRFHPTHEEAINHYLKPKLRGFSDGMCIIPEVDILKFEPQELPALIRGKKKKAHAHFSFPSRSKISSDVRGARADHQERRFE